LLLCYCCYCCLIAMYRKLLFGSLAAATGSAYAHTHVTAGAETKGPKSNPFSEKEWRKFKLREIQDVNHNSKIFKFALPEKDKNSKLALPVASCITTKYYEEQGKKKIFKDHIRL